MATWPQPPLQCAVSEPAHGLHWERASNKKQVLMLFRTAGVPLAHAPERAGRPRSGRRRQSPVLSSASRVSSPAENWRGALPAM